MASKSESEALARAAASLGRRARLGKRHARPTAPCPDFGPNPWAKLWPDLWPDLWFVTDPVRTPDPVAVAEKLPRGTGVIFRAFGAPEAPAVGRRLAAVARERKLILLVGADARLAAQVGAHGVHLPQRMMHRVLRLRAQHPNWRITGAAHDARALIAAQRLGLDAVLLSPVFPSRSPSATRPLGLMRFVRLAAMSGQPVFALGGMNGVTARRLSGSNAAGIAAVDGLTCFGSTSRDSTSNPETA